MDTPEQKSPDQPIAQPTIDQPAKQPGVASFQQTAPQPGAGPAIRSEPQPAQPQVDPATGKPKPPAYKLPSQDEIKDQQILAIGGLGLDWSQASDYNMLRIQANMLFEKLSAGTVKDQFSYSKDGKIIWVEKHPLITQFMQGGCGLLWFYSRQAGVSSPAIDAGMVAVALFFGYRAGAEARKNKAESPENPDKKILDDKGNVAVVKENREKKRAGRPRKKDAELESAIQDIREVAQAKENTEETRENN